ncbi:MAG: Hpt domain-containing protein [Chloroflexi bacterium]|nr:Hpt domain-containing protein [Chloroflexota bacterium]
MSESVIDRAVFDGLKESVGTDYIAELVDAFLEEAPTLIAQLRPALTAGDMETFRRAAHSVKSNAATFGATRLFELAKELEFMARENRLGEIGGRLEVLEEAFGRVAGALKKLRT